MSTAESPFAAPPNLIRLSVGLEAAGRLARRPRGRAGGLGGNHRRLASGACRPSRSTCSISACEARDRRLPAGHTRRPGALRLRADHACVPAPLKAGLQGRGLELQDVPHLLLSHPTSTTRAPAGSARARAPGAAGARLTDRRAASRQPEPVGAEARAGSTATSSTPSGASWRPCRRRTCARPATACSASTAFPPGHASHHVCYLDSDGTLYAGDAAGSGFSRARSCCRRRRRPSSTSRSGFDAGRARTAHSRAPRPDPTSASPTRPAGAPRRAAPAAAVLDCARWRRSHRGTSSRRPRWRSSATTRRRTFRRCRPGSPMPGSGAIGTSVAPRPPD